MSDVLRELAIKIGFNVDDSPLGHVDEKLKETKEHAHGFGKELEEVAERFTAFKIVEKGFDLGKEAIEGSAEAAIKFGEDMGQVQVALGGNEEAIKRYAKEIQDLAIESGKASAEIAGVTAVALRGFGDTADTMRVVKTAVEGAEAAGTDAATTMDILAKQARIYGDNSAEAAEHTMDLATASRTATLDVGQMAAMLPRVSQATHDLGVSQRETFAIMSTLSASPRALMALPQILEQILNPSKDLKKLLGGKNGLFAEWHVNSLQAAISQQGLVPVLQAVTSAAEKHKIALDKLFAGSGELKLITPLLTTQNAEYQRSMERLADAEGATAKAAEALHGGLNQTGHEIEQLQRRSDALQQNFGERIAPMMRQWKEMWVGVGEEASKAADAIQAALDWRNKWDERILNAVGLEVGDIDAGEARDIADRKMRDLGLDPIVQRAKVTQGAEHPIYHPPLAGGTGPGGKPEGISSRSYVHNGDIIVTLEGAAAADPHKIAEAISNRQTEALYRNVPNAATGENP